MNTRTPPPRDRDRSAMELSVPGQLELLVESEAVWRAVQQAEACHDSTRSGGSPRRYGFMDIIVVEVAAHLYGRGNADAVRILSDRQLWSRLRRCAEAAFPNDPTRRLSPQAPTRSQCYRARNHLLAGETLETLKRALRREAVNIVTEMGMFDADAQSWTHPSKSQVIVGDSTWIPAEVRFRGGSTETPDGEVVTLASPSADGTVILDAELVPNHHRRTGRDEANRAVAMLRRLLDESGDRLRPGLRGLVYDTALDAEAIDDVLAMKVLPIVKVPRTAGGELRHGDLGDHTFTTGDGAKHTLRVRAVNGSPTVTLTDNGVETPLRLRRSGIQWEHADQQWVAHGRYVIPPALAVPDHLRGASATIRLNSTRDEANSGQRRTRTLRAIPEADPAFDALSGAREDVERLSPEVRRSARRGLASDALRVAVCQALRLARVTAAYHRRTASDADAA